MGHSIFLTIDTFFPEQGFFSMPGVILAEKWRQGYNGSFCSSFLLAPSGSSTLFLPKLRFRGHIVVFLYCCNSVWKHNDCLKMHAPIMWVLRVCVAYDCIFGNTVPLLNNIWNCIIIITRPKPAYSRQVLAGGSVGPGYSRQACSPLIQLFFGFASELAV